MQPDHREYEMSSAMLLAEDRKHLDCDGYCVVHDVNADDLLLFAKELGQPYPDPRDNVLVKDIRPQTTATANPNTLSSRYGMSAFPLHTETAYLPTPPRFLLLYCVSPGSSRRTTILLDGRGVFDRMSNPRRTGTWVVKAGRRPFLCEALWGTPPHDFGIRYDCECLFPRGPTAKLEEQVFLEFIATSAPTNIEWTEKQLLIVNNLRMLHGRGPSHVDDRDRWLKRVLVAEETSNGLGY